MPDKRAATSRENGRLGGRPKKDAPPKPKPVRGSCVGRPQKPEPLVPYSISVPAPVKAKLVEMGTQRVREMLSDATEP